LIFIEHGTRQVYFAGCTAHPNGAWVTQQARQMTWEVEDRELPMKYLIRDHDTKFTGSFDTVFEGSGIEIINIPYQAPNANAIAERWVRTVREECLDRLIILNERHLRRVLQDYVAYYNARRPTGLDQDTCWAGIQVHEGSIRCRQVLGGIVHDYYREAAQAQSSLRLISEHYSFFITLTYVLRRRTPHLQNQQRAVNRSARCCLDNSTARKWRQTRVDQST
jgi:hypothetical protein